MKQTKRAILADCTKEIEASKIIANNTVKIKYKDGSEAIRLHNTDVITFLPDGKIQLNSGGWRTVTTKDRINTYSPARLWQNKGLWYVDGSLFYDNMLIDKDGKLISKPLQANEKKIDKIKKQIAGFVALITKDNLPIPDGSDCWDCLWHTKEGQSMGDAFNDNGHLLEHVKEGYLHGSLLVNAMREYGFADDSIKLHYGMKLTSTFKRALRKYLQKRLIKDITVK